jgi:ferredoxin
VIIRVDHDRCEGHARCNAISAELFTLDEVGYSSVDQLEIPTDRSELARLAQASCPEKAIILEE